MTRSLPEPEHRSKSDQIRERRLREKGKFPTRLVLIMLGICLVSFFGFCWFVMRGLGGGFH